MKSRIINAALFASFAGCVWLANWMLVTFGVLPILGGVPAGVVVAGLAFVLRDSMHDRMGAWWVLLAIAVGGVVAYVTSDGATIPTGVVSIAAASAAAFTLSELADMGVYAPLRERRWNTAVIVSGVVGSVIDSAVFLWLAFGSLEFIGGQVVVKSLTVGAGWLVARKLR